MQSHLTSQPRVSPDTCFIEESTPSVWRTAGPGSKLEWKIHRKMGSLNMYSSQTKAHKENIFSASVNELSTSLDLCVHVCATDEMEMVCSVGLYAGRWHSSLIWSLFHSLQMFHFNWAVIKWAETPVFFCDHQLTSLPKATRLWRWPSLSGTTEPQKQKRWSRYAGFWVRALLSRFQALLHALPA